MKRSTPAPALMEACAARPWRGEMPARCRTGSPRIQGREREIEQLRQCIDEAVQGRVRVLLVSGGAGVGKTALLSEFRRLVVARNGRFVEARCTADGSNQWSGSLGALRSLGQSLLAESDEELVALRQRIVATLGLRAGPLRSVPEFELILGDGTAGHTPSPSGSSDWAGEVLLSLLQLVASPQRPLVVLLEDIHLGDAPTVDLFGRTLTLEGLSGLVLVGSFRDDEVTATRPLSAALEGWSAPGCRLRHIHLENLRTPQVARILMQMLPMRARRALALAQSLMYAANGNPQETIELVNSLRHAGLLMPVVRDWRWNAGALRGYLAMHSGQARAGSQTRQAGAPATECSSSSPADDLDTLGILRASQALGSERNTARLCERAQEVLADVTGATRAVLCLWNEDANDWVPQAHASGGSGDDAPLHATTQGLPTSVLRYAARTREPLLLPDALADERFRQDPYFQPMAQCSLMVVPVVHHGSTPAVIVLENRALRAAFSESRLHAAMMIGAQLAVSLESAELYEKLERTVHEQTRQLREAHSRLVDEARRAGMAQIATNVLHNVGNVLTSVNVSTHVLATRVRQSRSARVADLAQLMESHSHELGTFFESDEKGRRLPSYVRELAQALEGEREELLGELTRLGSSVDHITNVVAMQQSYAGPSGVLEAATMSELVDDALRLQEDSLARDEVRVVKEYASMRQTPLDKTRVMQILVNLIENARQAMERTVGDRTLRVSIDEQPSTLRVQVEDTGCGIDASHLTRIFSHGFTTKQGGHGFGLHSCAVAAREMGGSLRVHSAGAGEGATFTLYLRFQSTAPE